MIKKIAFLSHLDLNLYLFRLPIMIKLVQEGHKVYAVCPKGDVFDKFKDYGITAIDYEIERSSLNPFKEIKTISNIKQTLDPLNLDILHTFMHKPNIYGTLAKKAKKTINTVTGLGSFFIYDDFRSKIVRFIIETLYRYTFKKSDGVIFQNSDDLKFFIDKHIVSSEKAFLVKSSGIDTNKFKNDIDISKLKDELNPDKKIVVLMIARVIRDKGVLEFIEAAKKLKDKALFIYAGDIDKGNKNALNEKIFDGVKYLGFRSDIKELIELCDIFVLPSYREGVPRTLLEASSMSKPIVTTDTVGCREVVDDGYNGFLAPVKESKILSEKIETLIDDKVLRDTMGKNGRIKAIKEFDVDVVVKQYLAVYDRVLKEL